MASAAMAFVPATVHAGTYTVFACRTPTDAAAGMGAWRMAWRTGGSNHSQDECPTGAFSFWMDRDVTHAANDYLLAEFAAPPDTLIEAYTFWRSVRVAPEYNYRYYENTTSGAHVAFDDCSGSCSGKGSSTPLSSENRISKSGRHDVRSLWLALTCSYDDDSSKRCPAHPSSRTAQLWLWRSDITLRDDVAPIIQSRPRGPLVDARRPLAGVQPVSITATDRGSGVYEARLRVDGRVIDAAPLNDNGGLCRQPFKVAKPCLLGTSGTVALNTAKVPDGTHKLEIVVTDATGTNADVWGPITIRTANATCNPSPRVGGAKLRAGVVRGHGKRRTLRRAVVTSRHRRTRVTGRLRTMAGRPMPGVRLCVAVRKDAAGAPLRWGGTVVTGRKGRFSYRVPRGPSRRLFFVYRTPAGAVTRRVIVRVRAPVRMHPSRHSLRTGDTVVLSGRLRGRSTSRRGVLVEIQARRPTGWQTFGTARANRRGRFRFRYRFTRTTGVQHYALRALVPRQRTYPYARGASRPVHLRVAG